MEETISYLQNRFKDEQSRFDHFENKCAKLLTAVSIVLAALSALAGLKNAVLFQLSSPITVMVFCSFAAAAICIGSSWGHAFSALRINDCPALPSSRDTAEYLKERGLRSAAAPHLQLLHRYLGKTQSCDRRQVQAVRARIFGACIRCGFHRPTSSAHYPQRTQRMTDSKKPQNNQNQTPPPPPTTEYQRRSEEPVVNRTTPPGKR